MTLPVDPPEPAPTGSAADVESTSTPASPRAGDDLPNRPQRAPRWRRWPWIAGAVAVAVALGGGLAYQLMPSEGDQAVQHCHAAVRDKLFSPSTAVFASDVRQNNTPPVFRVLGELDAQNKFGGTLRGEYICVLRHEDDGSWVTIDARVMTR